MGTKDIGLGTIKALDQFIDSHPDNGCHYADLQIGEQSRCLTCPFILCVAEEIHGNSKRKNPKDFWRKEVLTK